MSESKSDSKNIEFTIDESSTGQRLDKYLYDQLTTTPLLSEYVSFISRSLVKDRVVPIAHINEKTAKKASVRLRIGEVVSLSGETLFRILDSYKVERESDDTIVAQTVGFDFKSIIIEETDGYIVLNKPSGMVVHPGAGNSDSTLANYLRGYLEAKGEYDVAVERAGIVHRLDKAVSGLMVVAKTRKMQLHLKLQFESHQVFKVYRAKLSHSLDEEVFDKYSNQKFNLKAFAEAWKAGESTERADLDMSEWYRVVGYIKRDSVNRMRMRFEPVVELGSETGGGLVEAAEEVDSLDTHRGKKAISYIMPISLHDVYIKIETGRMHQIRATLSYLRAPVEGDSLYGRGRNLPDKIELASVALGFADEQDFRLFIS